MNRYLFTLATAFLLAYPSLSSAEQVVQANVNDLGSGTYWYSATNVVDTTTGQSALGGAGEIFCFDPHTHQPAGLGELLSYTVGQNIFANTAAWERGQDLVNKLFDDHYADYFAPMNDFNKTIGFQFVLWKLAADFNGTNLASLSFTTGDIHDTTADTDSANALLASLQSSTIDTGYRSSLYTIEFLGNVGHTSQNMIYLTPAVVPEPATFVMLGCGLIPALVMLRKGTRGQA